MGNIIIRQDKNWIVKPAQGAKVNFGHPFSRGLVGCWLMNGGAGMQVISLTSRHNGIGSAISWFPSLDGLSLNFNGTTSAVTVTSLKQFDEKNPQFTIICNANQIATTNDGYLVSQDISAGLKRWSIRTLNTGEVVFTYVTTGGTYIARTTTTTPILLNNFYTFVVTVNRPTVNTVKIYVNGIAQPLDNNSIAANWETAGHLVNFRMGLGRFGGWNGMINYMFCYIQFY